MKKNVRVLIIISICIFIYHCSSGELLDFTESNWPSICKLGKRNSPIDFPSKTSFNYTYTDNYIQLLSSNYSILKDETWKFYSNYKYLLNVTNLPGVLMISKNGITYAYDFIDMHFHILSEHTFGGANYDMEIHLVHRKNNIYLQNSGVLYDPDSANTLLVIGLLFQSKGTNSNSDIEKFNIGKNKSVEEVDLNKYITTADGFYHYLGGLTTPSCDEIVNWVVLDTVNYMSVEQYLEIEEWVHHSYKNGNSRMVKLLYDRTIYYVKQKKAILKNYSASSFKTNTIPNFSMIIVAVAAVFLIFFFRKKFDII